MILPLLQTRWYSLCYCELAFLNGRTFFACCSHHARPPTDTVAEHSEKAWCIHKSIERPGNYPASLRTTHPGLGHSLRTNNAQTMRSHARSHPERLGMQHVMYLVEPSIPLGKAPFPSTTTSPWHAWQKTSHYLQPPHLANDTTSEDLPDSGILVAHPYRYHRHRHSYPIAPQNGWRR